MQFSRNSSRTQPKKPAGYTAVPKPAASRGLAITLANAHQRKRRHERQEVLAEKKVFILSSLYCSPLSPLAVLRHFFFVFHLKSQNEMKMYLYSKCMLLWRTKGDFVWNFAFTLKNLCVPLRNFESIAKTLKYCFFSHELWQWPQSLSGNVKVLQVPISFFYHHHVLWVAPYVTNLIVNCLSVLICYIIFYYFILTLWNFWLKQQISKSSEQSMHRTKSPVHFFFFCYTWM